MAKNWYVVHVYSGFEKKIAQQITEQASQKGLAEQFESVSGTRGECSRGKTGEENQQRT